MAGAWTGGRVLVDLAVLFVNFPPHRHSLHEIGAFQLGIGVTLLLATVWTDAVSVALAGYLVAGGAHMVVHVLRAHLGGDAAQA